MAKGIRRVTIFEAADDGSMTEVASWGGEKSGKRKASKWGKRPERNMRLGFDAMRTFLDEMEGRHDKSSRKKKDGWVQDWPKNTMKANQKAFKTLKKLRVF